MKQELNMVQEEPLCAPIVATTTVPPQTGAAVQVEQSSTRKYELLVLGSLFLVTLFCTMGTYFWHARAWPSPSLWDTFSLRELDRSQTQAGSRFKEYQRWVPIRSGDYVIFAGGSAAIARMVTAVPRDNIIIRDKSDGARLVVLGANSFMVRTAAGGNQIVRRNEIDAVITAQTASR